MNNITLLRLILKAYKKILLSDVEDKGEKIYILSKIFEHITGKKHIFDVLKDFERKYSEILVNVSYDNGFLISQKTKIILRNEAIKYMKAYFFKDVTDLIIFEKIQKAYLEALEFLKDDRKEISGELGFIDFLDFLSREEQNVYYNVFGSSGSGKTTISYFLAFLINFGVKNIKKYLEENKPIPFINSFQNFYFTEWQEFHEFVKNSIKNNSLDLNAVVFDEFQELNKDHVKVLNRIRYFNKNRKPITFFIISHERNEFEKIAKQIDYYIYLYKPFKFRIYNKNYYLKPKMRLLFPSITKPKINGYVLDNINFNFSKEAFTIIKNAILDIEKKAKWQLICKEFIE